MPALFARSIDFDITPPVGTPMEGYAARKGVSEGVHDPLQGQVLLLRAGEVSLVLVTLDLLGVPLQFTRRVRSAVEARTGVPQDHIMLACSHTHSGPAGILTEVPGLHTEADPVLQEFLLRKIAGAAAEAQRTLEPATWGCTRGRVHGVGANRNNPLEGPQDEEVLVLRLDDDLGHPQTVLMNYGCHPTIMGHDNLLFSADFPGAARRALQAVYPDTIFMFANGASGDISTRFTRRGQTFTEVERSGRILAGEVLRALQFVTTSPSARLAAAAGQLELPFRNFPSAEEAQRQIEARQKELDELEAAGAAHGDIRKALTRLQGAQGQLLLRAALAGKSSVETEIQALALDDFTLLGLPGEPFTRIVLDIKDESPFEHTALVSYANDETGYFPDSQSFQTGTYEALISPYQQDVAGQISRAAIQLLEKVHV